MKRLWLVVMVVSMVINGIGQTDEHIRKFKTLYEDELRRSGVVGSGFVFLRNGATIADYRYGLADAAKDQRVDADTIWHWASNTKPFTGVAIMQLRDRGLLKLDDPVTKYLPELRAVHNRFGSMDEITIRHLMTHSAGFRSSTWPWGKGESWEPFEPTDYSQLVAMFPFTEILFKPGSKFSYSNPGIIFLGRIIEKLSGEHYETYIDKNILRPLEMDRTYFDTTPPYLLKHRSHSYYLRDGKRTEGRFDANTGITVSNSGLNAPLGDMVKWVSFLLGNQKKGEVYDLVLKRSSLEEMWQPQLPTDADSNGNRGFTTDIGLIFFLDRSLAPLHLGHGGEQNGFVSYIDFDPQKQTASILVLNTDVTYPSGTPAENEAIYRLRTAIRRLF